MAEVGKVGERRVEPIVEILATSLNAQGGKNPKDGQQPQNDTPAATFERKGDEETTMEPLAGTTYNENSLPVITVGPIPNKVNSAK